MTQTTNPATQKLTASEAYNEHIKTVRRNAAIERQRQDYQADIKRVLALYAEGSTKRLQSTPVQTFTEAKAYAVVKLPGGLDASVAAEKGARTRRERQGRVLDMSPEAVAKREKRRARRQARKERQAAAAV